MGAIAGALHQRDGDDAGRDDVGDDAARDGAEQRGGDNGDLGRAAAIAAHQHHRDVGEEFGAARPEQRLAEQHERDHHGGHDHQRRPENRGRVPGEIIGESRQRNLAALQVARQQEGGEAEHQEGERDQHDRQAGGAACAFQEERNDDERRDHAVQRLQRRDRQFGIAQRHIAARAEAGERRHDVVPGHCAGALAPGARRHVQVDERHRDGEHAGRELLGIEQHAAHAQQVAAPHDRAERQREGEQRDDDAERSAHRSRGDQILDLGLDAHSFGGQRLASLKYLIAPG